MKKIFLLFSLFICILFSGCSNSIESTESDEPKSLLQKIDAANAYAEFLKNSSTISYQTKVLDPSGTEIVSYINIDKNSYISSDSINYFTDSKGTTISYDEFGMEYTKHIYVGENAYEESKADWLIEGFSYTPAETILSTEEFVSEDNEHKMLKIETEITDSETIKLDAEKYGYGQYSIDKISSYYEVRKNNLEIHKYTKEYILKDGTSFIPFESRRTRFVFYDEIIPSEDGLKCNTLTLIENSGTDQEKSYEYSIPAKYKLKLVFSSDYENKVYTDDKFTNILRFNQNKLSEDTVGYIRKK